MINKMLKDAEGIFDFSEEISIQYEKYSLNILNYINIHIKEDDQIHNLIGNNSFDLIEDNHKVHIEFMKNIIKHREKKIFVHTLPWIYKIYSSRGVKLDYFKLELKYAIKAIENFIDKNSQEPLIKIYRQMLIWHDSLVEISKENIKKNIILNQNWSLEHESILKSLLEGDFKLLIDLSDKMINNKQDLINLYLNYIQPAMYKVGELWECGDISVAHEHLATSTVARLMSSIYPKHVLCESKRGLAIVSASANEYHQIGARMVADILEANGWDIKYIGANVPSDELIKLVDEVRPAFIALSVTMPFNIDNIIEEVKKIRSKYENIKIMVGGLAINTYPELKKMIDADAYPRDAYESLSIAEKWCNYDKQ